ncbi:MAG: 4'-phosphopantetheinyl transferase family protein [Acidimicrobiia bacterium]
MASGEHEVPPDDGWLTDREAAWMAGMRFPKRRLEYRLARWGAKAAIAATLNPPPSPHVVEIGHLPEGAPAGFVGDSPLKRRISMTDRAGWAVCAIAPPGVEVGVDLELVEERSRLFVADYFTPAEQAIAMVGNTVDPMVANLVWSAKESALKVMRTGLRRDTRSVEVSPGKPVDGEWIGLTVTVDDGRQFPGWWRRFGEFVLTMAADHPTLPPHSLSRVPALETAQPVHSWLEQPRESRTAHSRQQAADSE